MKTRYCMLAAPLLAGALLMSCLLAGCRQTNRTAPCDTLSDAIAGFEHPQDSARTKVWWFHGETETTREGITADLEAFKRAGVGGVVYYDQTHGKMENAFDAFTPAWWEMLRFSAEEAKRLGLTFEVHLSNGFVAGGPWITYETGMKRLAATETLLTGGRRFEGKLEAPVNSYHYYKDVAVLAFPTPAGGGGSSATVPAKLTSNVKGIDLHNLFDPQSDRLEKIPVHKEGAHVYVQLEFPQPFTARSITYEVRPKGKATTSATNVPAPPSDVFTGTGYRVLPDLGQLEVSDDGVHYKKVCDLKPIYRAHESWRQKTVSFAVAQGKYFRLNLHDWWEESDKRPDMQLGQVVLHGAAKLDQWEEKAGLYAEYLEADRTPGYSSAESVPVHSVVNLTDRMDDDGVLRWDVPEGDWIVMRFAYVPTGAKIKHGRRNLMGLECDKLSAEAAELHFRNYAGRILDSLSLHRNASLAGIAMDSHEAGAQNWTDDFIREFTVRQGYDPTPFLPAMMGYVMNSPEDSDGFLFDVRRNIADLIADRYYGTFERLCSERGVTFTAQAIGNALCIAGDPIQAKGRVAKPQGEFWGIHPDGNYDIKESSSAAHLYGKKIASAEAYTDVKFSQSLSDFKSLADYAYAYGINEFVVCASAYQPWLDRTPGSTGGGRHYCLNRNNTYWEYSRPFWDYQARTAFVMRQGKSSAQLCLYLGENAPVKILTYRLPDIPGGFDFDAFTSDALFTRMEASGGKVVLPDGVRYQMMVLPRNGDITLQALEKIASMVRKGIVVYGNRPVCPNPYKSAGAQSRYAELVDTLWGAEPASAYGSKPYGAGTVYWGMPLSEALAQAGIAPDVAMQRGNTKEVMIYFARRTLADADLYFLHNHKDTAEENVFTFAAAGNKAQLWDAVTGERFLLPVETAGNGTVTLPLYLHPRESCFVVITDQEETLPPTPWHKPADADEQPLDGPWSVTFDERLGGPGTVTLDTLCDWTTHADPRIRYYSGTAVYKKRISHRPAGERIYLDLGNPGFIARVFVNSADAGVVWCSPWTLEITRHLKEGDNELEIHVANSLMNRMIYDASLPEAERVTYAYPAIVSSNDALVPSGLRQVKIFSTDSYLLNIPYD